MDVACDARDGLDVEHAFGFAQASRLVAHEGRVAFMGVQEEKKIKLFGSIIIFKNINFNYILKTKTYFGFPRSAVVQNLVWCFCKKLEKA